MKKCLLYLPTYLPLLLLFIPGCWENEFFSAMCAVALVLPAPLPSLGQFRCILVQYSETQGNPFAIIWRLFSAAPSSLYFARPILITLAFLHSTQFPHFSKLVLFELPLPVHGLKTIPAVIWGTFRTYHDSPLLSRVTFSSTCCLVSENHYFLYFV